MIHLMHSFGYVRNVVVLRIEKNSSARSTVSDTMRFHSLGWIIFHTSSVSLENFMSFIAFLFRSVAQSAALIDQFDSSVAVGSIRCQMCGDAYKAMTTVVAHCQAKVDTAEDIRTLLNSSFPLMKNVRLSSSSSSPTSVSCSPFPSINWLSHPPPYHLFNWIAAHEHLLVPPVCNSMIHGLGCSWKVMIVGGPNQRTDYHIDDGEEVRNNTLRE